MGTLEIQCGTCKFKPELSYEISFPPTMVCEQYTEGIPDFVDTIDASYQKPCPKYEAKIK